MTGTSKDLTGCRVLLVEDDYFIADDLRRQFEESGTEVLGPVPSVEDALALIAATPQIDGAVLDVNLRDEMVYPVADALRERHVPFVFATGYEKTTIPARYTDVRHYDKPVGAAQVARSLFA
ncbi:response regulator [Methylobacterium sp. CM6247]